MALFLRGLLAGAAALLLMVVLLGATTASAFVLPSTPQQRAGRRAASPPSRLHVVDPATATDVVAAAADVATAAAAAGGSAMGEDAADAAGKAAQVFKLLTGPTGFGCLGLLALGVRAYTYFTAQSMMAKLVTLFATQGTTVELQYGNSLRNLFYYEPDGMEKLIVPTGESNEQRFGIIQDVCARLQAGAKAQYTVLPLKEDFDDLKIPEGSVDTVVSTYMLCKRKDPYKTFVKAMRLLKDGGAFVFVEPVVGEGPVVGVRRYLGQIHRATKAFGDPSLDIKTIVEAWANGVGKEDGFECDVDVEERDFVLDPHMWGVIYKRAVERDVDYEPTNAEKRKRRRREQATPTSKGFTPKKEK